MRLPHRFYPFLLLISFFLPVSALAQVDAVASGRLNVSVAQGSGQLALYSETDFSTPQPGINRVIIVFHGLKRNAGTYMRDMQQARSMAGAAGEHTLLIAPQFLNDDDASTYNLPADILRWHGSKWEGGEPALSPAPISSYDAIDTILAYLCNRTLFPNLREIVLAGHSGGGQVVQRYAVVGHQIVAVERADIAIRFVVANPSSYVYFDDYRPVSPTVLNCRKFNKWKYGFYNTPPYLGLSSASALETVYVTRNVTYLLGSSDDDPDGPNIEKSCAAEAEGATRLQRGTNYFNYLQSRHGAGLKHHVLLVSGVAHNAREMFSSACGLDSLFDTGTCNH